jgi:hypothetical protein
MTLRCDRTWLLVALVLATASALVWSDVAVAQQSQPPTQLWEQYPLDPEKGSPQPAGGGPQGSDPRSDGAPVGGDDGGGAATTDGERFPLQPIVVALAVLLLFMLLSVGVWAHGRHVPGSTLPERLRGRLNRLPVALGGFRGSSVADRLRSVRLRERIGAVRRPPLLDWSRPGSTARGLQLSFSGYGSHSRHPSAESTGREDERKRRPEPVSESPDLAGARDKPARPRRPKVRAPAQKQRLAQKPRPAKPPQPAKSPKPVRPAKPARPAGHGASPAPKRPVSGPPPQHKPTPKKVRGEKGRGRGQPQLVDADTLTERKLTCSIVWLRDGPVSDFYALAIGLQGHDFVVGRSPEFEWLGGDVPAEAREAHAILVDALVQDGWRPVGSEGAWYRQRFERPVGGGGSESSAL